MGLLSLFHESWLRTGIPVDGDHLIDQQKSTEHCGDVTNKHGHLHNHV